MVPAAIATFYFVSAIGAATTPPSGHVPCGASKLDPAIALCPSNFPCADLDVSDCLECFCPTDCKYGDSATARCTVADEDIRCDGERWFDVQFTCQYCFQSKAHQDYECEANYECSAAAGTEVDRHYTANCTISDPDFLCLGRREFLRREKCNWTAGIRWTTALALSVTLGGFGADR